MSTSRFAIGGVYLKGRNCIYRAREAAESRPRRGDIAAPEPRSARQSTPAEVKSRDLHPRHAGYRTCCATAADLAARCHRAAIEGRWATTMRFFAGR